MVLVSKFREGVLYMVNEERLQKLFIDLVEIDSPSGHEARLRDFLKNIWQERGLDTEEDEAGHRLGGDSGNILVRIPGTRPGPTILFCAHMDTVEPGRGVRAMVDNNGFIRSAGDTILGSDDKVAIAAIVEAFDCLQENHLSYPDIELLFTVSEEQGLLGSKEFDFSQLKARLAYVLDDGHPPGSIVVRSPCQNGIEYSVRGQAAHAGMSPEKGVNAIQAAALALAKMPCGRIDEETTCNFGIIQGGTARNIVADYCQIYGEARSLSPHKLDALTQKLSQTFIEEAGRYGASAEVNVKFLYPAVTLDASQEVCSLAQKAALKVGLPVQEVNTGGGSDASIINSHGIPCANLSVGMREVHTCQEHVAINDISSVAKWILAIIEEAGG